MAKAKIDAKDLNLSVNYLIMNAMLNRQSGYTQLTKDFISEVTTYLCGNKKNKRVVNKIQKLLNEYNTSRNNIISLRLYAVTVNKVYSGTMYVNSDTSPTLKLLYDRAKYDDNCKELLVQLLLLDLIDMPDFAVNMPDLNYVLDRVCLSRDKYHAGMENLMPVEIAPCRFMRLLASYVGAASRGTDVGYSAYDLIYNMILNAKGFRNVPVSGSRVEADLELLQDSEMSKTYSYVRGELRRVGGIGLVGVSLEDEDVLKYTEEFGVILPIIITRMGTDEEKLKVLTYLSRISISNTDLYSCIFSDVGFIMGIGFDGSGYEVKIFD